MSSPRGSLPFVTATKCQTLTPRVNTASTPELWTPRLPGNHDLAVAGVAAGGCGAVGDAADVARAPGSCTCAAAAGRASAPPPTTTAAVRVIAATDPETGTAATAGATLCARLRTTALGRQAAGAAPAVAAHTGIAAGVVPPATTSSSNDEPTIEAAVPRPPHCPHIGPAAATATALGIIGCAETAAVPTGCASGSGAALAANVNVKVFAAIDCQDSLGVATLAAHFALARPALGPPHVDRERFDAVWHHEELRPARVVKGLTAGRAILHALTSDAVKPPAARRLVSHGSVHAAAFGDAGIVGADLVVITIRGPTRLAATAAAQVTNGASVTIVAEGLIVGEDTAVVRVTGVIGAPILVVACEGYSVPAGAIGAGRFDGACIAIVAESGLVHGNAPLGQIAVVGGALIAIVAHDHGTAGALPPVAGIILGAEVAIVARDLIWYMRTTGLWIAAIVSAAIAIFAGQGAIRNARTQVTVVTSSADILVIAGRGIEQVQATLGGIAAIRGADIIVVASLQASEDASPPVAMVPRGAGVAVGTGGLVRGMYTRPGLVARIIGTDVAIIAVKLGTRDAEAIAASVADGAGVIIGTAPDNSGVSATCHGSTRILGARVPIVTILEACEAALPFPAQVPGRAGVAVVTASHIGRVQTANGAVATIVRADVGVVALQGGAAQALPIDANVPGGTCIVVIARGRVVQVQAPNCRITTIIGARVVVRADGSYPTNADSIFAKVTDGAAIAIGTGQPLIGGFEAAGSGLSIAGRGQAWCVGPGCRRRAFDVAGWGHLALVGQLGLIAEESPVADVAVLQGHTIALFLTVARNGEAGTEAAIAFISHGARVAVVAIDHVVFKVAPPEAVAGIISAGVAIVATDGRTDTDSGLAMVTDGADIAIDALALRQGLLGASIGTVTGIDGTRITVVAEAHGRVQDRFIDVAITIVVEAVARLLTWRPGITLAKSISPADPLADANSPLIAHRARSPKRERH